MSASRLVWLSLVVAVVGCASGEENTEVVSSQETTIARCPASNPEVATTTPSETANGQRGEGGGPSTGIPNEGPGSTGESTSEKGDSAGQQKSNSANVTQPGCDPGANAGGGYGSRGAAQEAQSSSSSSSG